MYLPDYPFQISYGPADKRLHNFYIPALSRSIMYDRSAGFFSSTSLSIAAAGVVQLIHNNGRMRMLVGAKLQEEDVQAIRQGYDLATRVGKCMLEAFPAPLDALLKRRLEVLAWMVAHGMLDIRVVLPTNQQGTPLPMNESYEYYHAKEGVFTDEQDNQIAFSGSINESQMAWLHNYEQFSVYRSWDASRPYLAQVQYRLNALWEGTEPGWIALPIPQAVREELIVYSPDEMPLTDPLAADNPPLVFHAIAEKNALYVEQPKSPPRDLQAEREQLLITFLRDAPYLRHAARLGAATSAISPYPHQHRVADAIVQQFPERFLIADEVGLGKTIEAGLAIRQLLISGRVRRCLILAPKSVLRQWQEELYEKFALNIPIYDGQLFSDVFQTTLALTPDAPTDNPFDSQPVLLVSSQLVKRLPRQAEVIAASPWDLIVVDEAHHARRKNFLDMSHYHPNRLLELLTALKERTQGMLLLTATPMQIHPIEVWDLLKVLGVGGKWGAHHDYFLRFFTELRQAGQGITDTDWDFLFTMVQDFLSTGGRTDEAFMLLGKQKLGTVDWHQIQELLQTTKHAAIINKLSSSAQAWVRAYIQHHTPLRRSIFRNTRNVLRQYHQKGLMKDHIPDRKPYLQWIPMHPDERVLYERIEEYITTFYARYEQEHKGLGFIMTIYRRRLTSSFAAVCKSIERRLAYLKGQVDTVGLEDDDLEQDDLEQDTGEFLEATSRKTLYQEEIQYVEDFLDELRQHTNESKVAQLRDDLETIFKQRETVVLFTQYTDTMDYLRDHLVQNHGNQVACYSGRGGETWYQGTWHIVPKEKIKTAFRSGEDIKILLCTEAASEGLNLQTCGVLINYDMPWNPMRVEQRIGRIDRIGQHYQEIWVYNYFYEETIEALIYQRLSQRIDWFETVVGGLQPILSRVAQSIQKLVMVAKADRQQIIEQEIADLESEWNKQQENMFHLDDYLEHNLEKDTPTVPVMLSDIARILTTTPSLQQRFTPHPTIDHTYFLSWQDALIPVTFTPQVFDDHALDLKVQLLTYGVSLFDELLQSLSWEQSSIPAETGVYRCCSNEPIMARAYYRVGKSCPEPIQTLSILETMTPDDLWTVELCHNAEADFRQALAKLIHQMQTVISNQQKAKYATGVAKAQELLKHAALIEILLGQKEQLWQIESYPHNYTQTAIEGLARHKYPFAPLITLVDITTIHLSPTDPFCLDRHASSQDVLRHEMSRLKTKAEEMVKELKAQEKRSIVLPTAPLVVGEVMSVGG